MLTRIKLTLKQHRFETIATVVLCLVAAAAALVETYRLNSIHIRRRCGLARGAYVLRLLTIPNAAPACERPVQRYLQAYGLLRTLALLPFIVGILFGAPLVAKEIEQGTAPLSWARSRITAAAGCRKDVHGAALLIVPRCW